MKFTGAICIALVIVLVSSLAQTNAVVENKGVCVPNELKPCIPAAKTGKPSTECCGVLKKQQSCLCGYIKDPKFSPYVNSKYTHQVLATCGVPYPKCLK